LDADDEAIMKKERAKKRQIDIIRKLPELEEEGSEGRSVVLRFCTNPVEAIDSGSGAVAAVRCERMDLETQDDGSRRPIGTGEFEVLPAQLVLRSAGYKSEPLLGMTPFPWGTVANEKGRIADEAIEGGAAGLYVAGWLKRGPTGIIGSNIPDAKETAAAILEDRGTGKLHSATASDGAERVVEIVAANGGEVVSWDGWCRIDSTEVARGEAAGKLREKVVSISEMEDIARN